MAERQVADPAPAPVSGAGDEPPATPATPPNPWVARAKWLIGLMSSRPFRWGFVAITVALAIWAVTEEEHSIRVALGNIGSLRMLGALAGDLGAALATMQLWRALLAGLGSPLPPGISARVMFIGQLGKYLPGSLWPILVQMELASEYKVPRHRSASASALTIVLSLLTGLLVALATLPFVARDAPYRWVFVAVPVLLVCLYPKVLNRILATLLRLARRPPLDHQFSGRALATAVGWSIVAWLCYGLQIWLLITRLGASPGRAALLAVGGFAFAWCVGCVVPIAPAGGGFRELILIGLLGPVVGVGSATAVALLSRVLTILVDLITAGGAVGYSRYARARAQGAGPT